MFAVMPTVFRVDRVDDADGHRAPSQGGSIAFPSAPVLSVDRDGVSPNPVTCGTRGATASIRRRLPLVDAVGVRVRLDGGEDLLAIAADLGRSPGVLRRALRGAGLPVPPWRPPLPVLDPAVLRDCYIGQRMSISQIATRLGYSRGTVAVALRSAGIPRRGRDERPPAVDRPVIGAEQLRNLYLRRGLTARQVADELACEPAAVRAALKRHGITRPPVSTVLEVDRDTLTRLYAAERLNDRVIAARYGVPTWRVTRRRRELNIVRQRASRARAGAAPSRPGPEVLHRLFVTQALPIRVIAEQFGTSPRLVRRWLTDAGHRLQPRGDRRQDPPAALGPVVFALHNDPEVTALLRRHEIHRDHRDGDPGGPAADRVDPPRVDPPVPSTGLSADRGCPSTTSHC